MNSSDTSSRFIPTSALSTAFLNCRDAVLEQWALRVTAEIPVAAKLGEPILTDTLPTLYDDIVEALTIGVSRPSQHRERLLPLPMVGNGPT
jgi:hypothetical protein